MQTQTEKDVARELGAALRKLGESKAVTKFPNSYGNLKTKNAYCVHLTVYFRWLREAKGVVMTPDELVQEQLDPNNRNQPKSVCLHAIIVVLVFLALISTQP